MHPGPPPPGFQQILVAVGQLSHRERRLGDPVGPARNGPEEKTNDKNQKEFPWNFSPP